jgi:guanyl-specific ribonuclease Sa
MALDRPQEAWQKAQQLKEAGPFDYYRLTAAQHSLLETTWQALYPSIPYPCSTRSCPGRIRDAHKQLLAELQYHLSQPPLAISQLITTPPPVENTNSTTAGQAVLAATAAAATTAATPATTIVATATGSTSAPAKSAEPLSARYSFAPGVTEVREFGNPIPYTRVTDALVEKLVAQSEDYRRLFIDNEEVAAEATVNDAVAQQEAGLLGGSLQDKDNGQPKLPSPSAVKAMNKDEVTTQYRLELQVDEVPAELDTNAKVAAAIIQHRESKAE